MGLPRLAQSPPNPWHFLSVSCHVAFCHAREGTVGLHSTVRAGCQNQPGDWRGRTFRPPDLWGEEGGEAEAVTNGQRLSQSRLRNEASMTPPRTVPRPASSKSFHTGNHNASACHHVRLPAPWGRKQLCSRLRPTYLFIWLSIRVL